MKTLEKTAEEIMNLIENHYSSIHDVKSQIKEYVEEAIKADRENVATHAILKYDEEGIGISGVDKDSIINAPNIILE